MVYLMMDKNTRGNLVKIGVSRDLTSRRRSYKTHNPYAIMRSSCAGTESQESKAHSILARNGKRIKGTEWFEVSDEMFERLYKQGMKAIFPKQNPIHFHESF